MERDRFEEVNEEDRDSRWFSMEIREGVVDNGEDSEGNGNGGPWDIAFGIRRIESSEGTLVSTF